MTIPSASFRGAGKAREPGIHTHRLWLWIPVCALARATGMTAEGLAR
jgi:hypothetical protein